MFIDPAKANSLKYVTAVQTGKLDTTLNGLEEPKVPPQRNMLADFKRNKQNFTDLRTMIEETQKPENSNFGLDIVKVAQEIKEKREL